MRSNVDRVRPTASIESAFERFQDRASPTLCVTDAEGRIVGLLTRQALAEVVMIRSVRPDWRFARRA
jgi:CBS-domain-containing membrane protein